MDWPSQMPRAALISSSREVAAGILAAIEVTCWCPVCPAVNLADVRKDEELSGPVCPGLSVPHEGWVS